MLKALNRQYNFQLLESKWQGLWLSNQVQKQGQKFYCLSMFPYPSGTLHIGHVRVYSISDTISRFQHLQGRQVLHPIGWDSFGLPAENAAIERKIKPNIWTQSNISQMKTQMQQLGLNFDWDKEISTCSPEYYKWTQWIFLQLFDKGLAYQKEAYINWDPVQNTVLANEQVDEHGNSWRSGAKIERRMMKQWYFKITNYAEELISGLRELNWPKPVIEMQKGWIGKTSGFRLKFNTNAEPLEVFTTRIETIMGVTFLALAPEHPVVQNFGTDQEWAEIDKMKNKSEALRKESKNSISLSQVWAYHPVTGERLPVIVSEYVLADVGTGCVMGVPGHDIRDLEVSKNMGFPIKRVINEGALINSGEYNGLSIDQAVAAVVKNLKAEPGVNYRMKDWLVSRQRYWGVPVPIIHCDNCGLVPDYNLPVLLPSQENKEAWLKTPCPLCGELSTRDPDTLDTFVDSSWYYLRYLDPKNTEKIVDPDKAKLWTPVDTYIGGIEHAIMHLLYSRFIHKFLRDLNVVSCNEPFTELFTQGLVLGKSYKHNGRYVTEQEAEKVENVEIKYEKMSKSKHNGVNPEDIRQEWGADSLKLAVLFAAPSEKQIEWDGSLLRTMRNFLVSVYDLKPVKEEGKRFESKRFVKEITKAVNGKKLHVAIARLMEYLNLLKKSPNQANFQEFLIMLYPFAPHLSSELYEKHFESDVRTVDWPTVE